MQIWSRFNLLWEALLPRADTIPSACYTTCNNAYLEAQQVGETPALCDSGSAFFEYYNSCRTCLASTNTTIAEAFPALQESVDYCDVLSPQGTSSAPSSTPLGSALSWSLLTSMSEGTVTPSRSLANVTIPYTTVAGGSTIVWSFVTLITSYAPIPATATVEITTLVGGRPATLTFTTSYLVLPSATSQQHDLTTGSVDNSSSTSLPSPPSEAPDLAWVAGPVVGGVAGVAAAVLLGYIWRRRRRAKTAPVEIGPSEERKAELHPNHLPAEMVSVNEPRSPQELDGDELAMPVREPR